MIQKAKGTQDYFAKEAQILKLTLNKLEKVALAYNFAFVKTPIFENINLFKRAVGEESDIVNKEMFELVAKNNKDHFVLRPEGTAPIVRMVLENKLTELGKKQRLYYEGVMFRYEQPQKGRQREFFQFGVELLNDSSLLADLEVLLLGKQILDEFKIKKYQLRLNCIGTLDSRKTYLKALKKYYLLNKDKLSIDSLTRLDNNVLRILDSKDSADILINNNAPSIIDYLDKKEQDTFNTLCDELKKLKVSFIIDNKLVRGLDYYNGLVFEFVSTEEKVLGAKDTIIGGGRYDHLIAQFDSKKDVPAVGFALGISRLILVAIDNLKKELIINNNYYVMSTSFEFTSFALEVATKLRAKNFQVELDCSLQKFEKKMRKAIKNNYKQLIIVGKETLAGEVIIKNLQTEEQKTIKLNSL